MRLWRKYLDEMMDHIVKEQIITAAKRVRLSRWLADVLHGIRRQSYRYQSPPARRSIR